MNANGETAGRVVDAWASFCADNNLDGTLGFDAMSDAVAALRESAETGEPVAFIRCECGAEWRYSINLLDGSPVWMRPKAKRGAPCQHTKDQAEALVGGEWVRVEQSGSSAASRSGVDS